MIELLAGGSVKVDTSTFQNDMINFSDKDDVLTYLIHLGYLGYDQQQETAFVPNEEIRLELTKAVKRKMDFVSERIGCTAGCDTGWRCGKRC